MKTKRDLEELLLANDWPRRLVRKLSEAFPAETESDVEEDDEDEMTSLLDALTAAKKNISVQ